MKPIQHALCLVAVVWAVGVMSAQAAEGSVAAKKRPVGAREDKTVPATQGLAPDVRDEISGRPLRTGQVVFQVLLAEIALQRGELELASSAYADLATRTRDPKVLERTVAVAGFARRFDLALEAARLLVDLEPESKSAQQILASVMIAADQLDDLAPNLIRMLELEKESLPQNLLGLNRMMARNPNRLAVFRLIETVGRHFSGVAEAHFAIAVAAGSAGLNERALNETKRALELRPNWTTASLLQAQLIARHSAPEAIEYLQTVIDRNPKSGDARMLLARLLVSEKRYDEARQQFGVLLEAHPDNPDVVFPVAILALQQGDRALAKIQFQRFLALPVADKNFANYYLGQIAEEEKQPDEALAYYARVVSGEQYMPAQLRRARLLVERGQLDSARQVLQAVKGVTKEERVQLAIAEAALLRDAKQPREAFDVLEPVLASQPDQTELLYESALLAEKIGRLDVLESRLRRLIELRPNSAQAYNALGYSLADRNLRLPEARALIEKALELSPDDYYILDSMGWVLFRQGDLNAALAHLERAFARKDDPEIAAHIAEVLWSLGRQDEARRTLVEARRKYPDSEALSEAFKKFAP